MLNHLTIPRARWSVMWVRKGKIHEKKFGDNWNGAMEFYNKVLLAGRKGVTLRCCNVGIEPPENLKPREVTKYKIKTRIVRRNGKKYRARVKVPYEVHEHKLKELNAQGIWWCPYCAKLRRFQPKKFKRKITYHCPMCDISSRDGHVRRWNPEAVILDYRRRQKGGKRRRGRNS